MNNKDLADLLKYSNPKELWIVTWNNLLKILICPFKVIVLNDIGTLKKGQLVWVDEVKLTRELKTVYMINGKGYYYSHFNILEQ